MNATSTVGAVAPGQAAPQRLLRDEAPSLAGHGGSTANKIYDAIDAARRAADPDIVVYDAAASLPDLALMINAKVEATLRAAKSATLNALDVGRLLIAAKKQVTHGQWDLWLQANCKVAPRTARAYMRLASKLPMLPAKTATVADLPLRDAIRAVATPALAPTRLQLRSITRDDRERTVLALRKSAKSISRAARDIEFNLIKGSGLAALRNKLTAAIDAVNRLIAAEVDTTSSECVIAQIGSDHA
jgi:hypothetical protein